jgi:dienelactone hydrolase
MRARLLTVIAALMAAASTAPVNAETVRFQAGGYTDFRQLFLREAPATTVSLTATLSFPAEARDRSPAIVIVHSIAGYQEANEGWHADQFRKAGFATLTYVSPTARIMLEGASSVSNSGPPPWGSAVAEAYAALKLLANDPRIDASRIAIVGFSFGGEVAHLSAFERLRTALVPGDLRFAAHVAYYPAGVNGLQARQDYTGAPILMLLGDKDDNLPVAKTEEYLTYLKGAGRTPPIDVSIYPGAYHAWTVSSLSSPRFYAQYPSTRKCPYILLGSGRPALLIGGQETPMEPVVMQSCLKDGQGYAMAYDEPARAKSTRETLAFLVKQLRP